MLLSKIFAVAALGVSGAAMASVQGLYKADCLAIEAEGLSIGRTANFEKETAVQDQIIYLDLACEAPGYSFTFVGPYALAEDGTANFTSATIQLTALDERVASSFTAQKLCGVEAWEAGKPQEVAGLDCGGTQIPEAGSVSYDRVKEVEGGIVFGAITDELDGTTAEKRPAEYDEASVYKAVAVKAPVPEVTAAKTR